MLGSADGHVSCSFLDSYASNLAGHDICLVLCCTGLARGERMQTIIPVVAIPSVKDGSSFAHRGLIRLLCERKKKMP